MQVASCKFISCNGVWQLKALRSIACLSQLAAWLKIRISIEQEKREEKQGKQQEVGAESRSREQEQEQGAASTANNVLTVNECDWLGLKRVWQRVTIHTHRDTQTRPLQRLAKCWAGLQSLNISLYPASCDCFGLCRCTANQASLPVQRMQGICQSSWSLPVVGFFVALRPVHGTRRQTHLDTAWSVLQSIWILCIFSQARPRCSARLLLLLPLLLLLLLLLLPC